MIGRHSALRIAVPLAAACVMVVSEPVAAFKLETHIWIGQQVLNDVLPDGKVTIEPFGEFTVAPEIVAALRARPREYLSGTMGPDVFPDLAAGQMTVHPGNTAPSDAAAWSTDRWLRHLLDFYSANPQYTAFVYGFLSHAGSDAFAHSYVNTYAGDIFDLTNGETEVELRHVMLEEYIKNKMPPITNAAGTILQPYDIVADPTGDLVTFDLPYHLFYLPDVAEQYRRNPATRYLAEMHDFRLGLFVHDQLLIFGQEHKRVLRLGMQFDLPHCLTVLVLVNPHLANGSPCLWGQLSRGLEPQRVVVPVRYVRQVRKRQRGGLP